MKHSFLFVCLLFFQIVAFPQQRKVTDGGKTYVIHEVQKGETIFSLSEAYGVDQKELLNANPSLIFGLKTGQDLKIPVRELPGKRIVPGDYPQEQEPLPSFHTYKVRRKNTLHSISKHYGLSIEDIIKYNPEVKKGLRKGMVLLIPDAAELAKMKDVQEKKTDQANMHRVVGDDTLYSLSKKYDRSIASILELNPEVEEGLKVGMEIRLPIEKEEVIEEPVSVEKDGFFTHLVESGETFWRLERRYGTSRSELEEHNPVLKKGLMAGLRIRIPLRHIPEVHWPEVNESQFEKHQVKPGETLYRLSALYQTKISDLKKVNPVLGYRGLIAGETILIPRKDLVELPETKAVLGKPKPAGNCEPDFRAAFKNYQVALLLPLYLEANDTINQIKLTPGEFKHDSLLMTRFEEAVEAGRDTFTVRGEKIIDPRSENFMHFYEGVLLAVDSMQRSGMNVKLHVFDTNQDQQVIDSLVVLDVFMGLDLIIGPVFPNLQKRVADFAYKNRIPMVSPLSSGGGFEKNNPYYFKVNPDKELLIRNTARYLGEEYFDKNLIVLQMGEYKHLPEAGLVSLSREKFFSTGFNNQVEEVLFREYDFTREGSWGLSRILSKTRENVFIIPSQTEAQISIAVTNLNSIAEKYPVTLIGLSNYQHYRSIQPEYYHHVKLHLLSPYFADYQSPHTNHFIRNFRKQFYAEPNQFSFQGYDVAFYFMSALYRYGKDFVDCLPAHRVALTQGNFNFEKQSRFGGYMNQGLFVVSYNPDYTITNEKSNVLMMGK